MTTVVVVGFSVVVLPGDPARPAGIALRVAVGPREVNRAGQRVGRVPLFSVPKETTLFGLLPVEAAGVDADRGRGGERDVVPNGDRAAAAAVVGDGKRRSADADAPPVGSPVGPPAPWNCNVPAEMLSRRHTCCCRRGPAARADLGDGPRPLRTPERVMLPPGRVNRAAGGTGEHHVDGGRPRRGYAAACRRRS